LPHDLGSTRRRAELATSAQAGQDLLQMVPATISGALAALNYIDELDLPLTRSLIRRDEDGQQGDMTSPRCARC
jgi:hypothetical protein